MRLGIDIGGTHTDGALVNNEQVLNTVKLTTNNNKLSQTILNTGQQLIKNYDPQEIEQITLSTTLATNTIVKNDYQKTALLLIPGPGLTQNWADFSTTNISGYINHRGQEVQAIDKTEVISAVNKLLDSGVKKIGVCGKFATRNPEHELKIKKIIKNNFPELETISLSHQLTPKLNFPRRQVTTYFNRALYESQQNFIANIKSGFRELNLNCPIYLLKADGGTMNLKEAKQIPIETINSGPSASIMGILALTKPQQNTLGIDIGGTTTDISLFINQEPLFKPDGITINNYNSSIRGLYNKSIGCGGDSVVQIKDGKLTIGPQRKGAAAALGGPAPTPTDALVVLDKLQLGDRNKAYNSLKTLSEKLDLSPQQIAEKIISRFSENIETEVRKIINELQSQPVYTINELLSDYTLDLHHLVGIGGPAEALIPELANRLNLSYTIPEQSKIANAIGAALARKTTQCTLYADTDQGYYHILQFSQQQEIDSNFTLEDAQKTAVKQLAEQNYPQDNIEITNSQSFNLVRGFRTTGKILEVTAQVKPDLYKVALSCH
ncbi:ROK family protein [Halanaerobacter jeridensis]|uniref:N-methylhydantoinase A/oxoprolinase/acetone carboxylase beta subunit n=1 Tax=Halanaerobacter jeridensis TaxID=706427 RepID=A0A939BPV8_9FIRM|nr:hydantoinase/oxoprolinase family protein [Halanaerobacter jeridensis]MBM7557542.1 N-methylhydantoinase A/oxoprolinase/acetone carboxylase beta subunit [Halanaerobacter jeridensis]